MKYHIVGVEKCGTQSLRHLFDQQGHDVICNEWSYACKDGPEKHLELLPNYQVILMERDPVQRVWADYNYAIQHMQIPEISLKEALEKHPRFLAGSNYKKWEKHWSKTNPIVHDLDSMGLKFINNHNPHKPQLSLDLFKYIEEQLEKNPYEDYFRTDMNLPHFFKKGGGTTGVYNRII